MDRERLEKIFRENTIGIVTVMVAVFLALQNHYPLVKMLASFSFLILSAPFIVIGYRNGIAYGLAGFLSLGLIFSFLYGVLAGLLFLILYGPLFLAISWGLERKKTMMEILALGGLAFFISIFLIGVFLSKFGQVDLGELVTNLAIENRDELLKILDGQTIGEIDLSDMKATVVLFYKNIIAIFPIILLITSGVIGYLNYKLASYILKLSGTRGIYVPELGRFKLPRSILIGIATSFVFLSILKLRRVAYYPAFMLNIASLFSFLFLIQGVALLSYFLKKTNVQKVFRIIIIVFLINVGIMNRLLFFLGVLDILFDFRKMRK